MTKPLEGIRILDLSISLTGPYAAPLQAFFAALIASCNRSGE